VFNGGKYREPRGQGMKFFPGLDITESAKKKRCNRRISSFTRRRAGQNILSGAVYQRREGEAGSGGLSKRGFITSLPPGEEKL